MNRPKPLFLIAGGSPRDPKGIVSYMARTLQECGRKEPRVAYLGMANGDSMPFYLSIRSLLQQAGAGDVSLVRLARTTVDLDAAKQALETADAIYLSGGEVEDGMRWLEQHGLVGFLNEMRNQGKLFLGMSAGSIMMGTHWVRWKNPNDDATAELFDCLGFAPTTFDTHAEDEDWKELKMALTLQGPGARGYGIPSGGMVSVDGQGQIIAIPIKAMVDPDAVFLDNLADGIHEALEEMKREGIPLPPRPIRNPALDRLRAEDEARAKRR